MDGSDTQRELQDAALRLLEEARAQRDPNTNNMFGEA